MTINREIEKIFRYANIILEHCFFFFFFSRTAASRDPGSVSEAESDEENEEGDYTVYECPGLASVSSLI